MEPRLGFIGLAMTGAVMVSEDVEVFTSAVPCHGSADEWRLVYCRWEGCEEPSPERDSGARCLRAIRVTTSAVWSFFSSLQNIQ